MKKIINFPSKKILDSYKYYKNYIEIKNQLLKEINQKEIKNVIKEILIAVKNKKIYFLVVTVVQLQLLSI